MNEENNAAVNVKNQMNYTASEKKMIKKLFWRMMFLGFNMSYTRQQGVAWTWAHRPIYRTIYKDNDDKYWEAMKRNLEFFNTTPNMAGIVSGLAVSMEQENARLKEFDTKAISGLKIGLMGPMAGIGDTLFSGVLALVIGAIALSFQKTGNLLYLVFGLVGFAVNILVRWYGLKYGYKMGAKYIQKAVESGIMTMFTKASAIVGVTVVGGMIATLVKVPVVLKTKINGQTLDLQAIFDQIMPCLLPLLLSLGCFYFLRKGTSPVRVLLVVVVVGFLLTFAQITGTVS
ncbi:PTS system mannose/fructose/sorbose family transporter subunit IID [Sporolactobacillus shoreicorticis]|uniref:PTS system mannose/fructose/sorbose family transporter subunit IID n=1 Tax=Sporolactobacillus shoreicorticis TaxID=1923877 RepID=A0ABW5S0H2_9BACL|nr:PTS system mannose/fructose/sorbose family transporter subunit IID [Sporolactobacillus shoreicorticis]MCO7124707.1 PTS system mannose/fructose/sorbose family transporter subunit IID [Sporolactobacillus shoreicorticis]